MDIDRTQPDESLPLALGGATQISHQVPTASVSSTAPLGAGC